MTVLCTVQHNIGRILLQRPKFLNAITLPMYESITHHLLKWKRDPNVHAVVIQGQKSRAFCSGGDIRQLAALQGQISEQLQFCEYGFQLNQLINDYPKPYIALMDGITMGAGVGISLHGSHPVASEQFSFAMPENGIGLFPDVGASHIFSRCPGKFGLYLGLSGDQIGAADALALGLVSAVVPAEHFKLVTDALGRCDLSGSNAHHLVTRCIQQFAIPAQPAPLLSKAAEINACFSGHTLEQIMNNLSETQDEWCQALHARLLTKAPLSLKVSLKQLTSAQSKSLAACLETDRLLMRHFLQGRDFYEGVRALIVDKDKNPHWSPRTISEVTPLMVNRYFTQEKPRLIETPLENYQFFAY